MQEEIIVAEAEEPKEIVTNADRVNEEISAENVEETEILSTGTAPVER